MAAMMAVAATAMTVVVVVARVVVDATMSKPLVMLSLSPFHSQWHAPVRTGVLNGPVGATAAVVETAAAMMAVAECRNNPTTLHKGPCRRVRAHRHHRVNATNHRRRVRVMINRADKICQKGCQNKARPVNDFFW